MHRSAVQCSAMQISAIQCSAVQFRVLSGDLSNHRIDCQAVRLHRDWIGGVQSAAFSLQRLVFSVHSALCNV